MEKLSVLKCRLAEMSDLVIRPGQSIFRRIVGESRRVLLPWRHGYGCRGVFVHGIAVLLLLLEENLAGVAPPPNPHFRRHHCHTHAHCLPPSAVRTACRTIRTTTPLFALQLFRLSFTPRSVRHRKCSLHRQDEIPPEKCSTQSVSVPVRISIDQRI